MRFETEKDRENENKCKKVLEDTWGMRVIKLDGRNETRYNLDFLIEDPSLGRAVRVVEFKQREDIATDTFKEGVLLGLQKFNKGIEYYDKNGLDFYFIGCFKNGYMAYKYNPDDDLSVVYKNAGKNPEPCILIPPEKWRTLDERKQ